MGKYKYLLGKMMLLALLAVVPAHLAYSLAAPASVPTAHGDIVRNDARITFEWPQPVKFQAEAKGRVVTIRFERNANPNFGAMLSTLSPYITSATRKADGKTIELTLDKPYLIRTFMSDNIGGIELLDIDPTRRQSLMAANLSPSAGTPETPAVPATEGASLPAAPLPQHTVPAESPPALEPSDSSAMPTAKAEGAPTPEASLPPVKPGEVRIGVSTQQDSAVLHLPFTERMAAAVFIRTGYVWLVLNKPIALDLSEFEDMPKTIIGKGQLMPNKQATVLRIPLNDNIYASVAQEDNSFQWAVVLAAKKRPPTAPLKINVNTDPPAPPHVFVPSLEMAEPVTLQDPTIGDEIAVTPLFAVGEGVSSSRDFVEFTLLQTAQGVAVEKKSDDVTLTPLRNGLRISLPQGAALTPGLPEVAENADTDALKASATLFPYDSWKIATDRPRRVILRELFQRIVTAENVQEANDARLRLAQIYLSEGMASETLGLLDGINRTDNAYYRSAKLAAMRGAAQFLLSRFTESARDFSAAELNNNKEMDYWRSMLKDLLGAPTKYDFMALNEDYISKYPPLFRQRLSVVAADRAVDGKEYNMALMIFDTLKPPRPLVMPTPKAEESKDKKEEKKEEGKKEEKKESKEAEKENKEKEKEPEKKEAKDDKDAVKQAEASLIDPINPYVDYLMGKISVDTGLDQDGLDIWERLSKDYDHPFVQARAEYARIIYDMDHGKLSREELIDRLERLRLAWHGDSLELKVLRLLGDLYEENKQYVDAMRIWDGVITSFPSSGDAHEMATKLEETFVTVFNNGYVEKLPTLDTLALYYQYRAYAPSGDRGRELVVRLADRLLTVDLLDQAATLLDHQMRFETEKVQRSQLGAKVAAIQLENRQPKKALSALEDSMYGENPLPLRLLRNRLAAQALTQIKQHDKAMIILGQDDSEEAESIRMDIYWQQRDWARLVVSVETMLKNRKDITAPLTLDESQRVMQLALAYIFENDTMQLQYLRDYFGPLMANNPNKPMFDFITASDVSPTPSNFDEVLKRLSDTRSFMENYKARISLAELDAAMKAEEALKKATPEKATP